MTTSSHFGSFSTSAIAYLHGKEQSAPWENAICLHVDVGLAVTFPNHLTKSGPIDVERSDLSQRNTML